MIRILVLVLAAANLMYFGWSRWVDQQAPRLVAPATTGAATPTAIAQANPAAPCAMVGPVAEEVRAMEIDQLLRDMQLLPLRRVVTAEVPEGWWVHVDNADAASQAAALRAIRNAGLSDAVAMPDDPQFRISVGVFNDEARARNRAAAVRALRLEPVVARRMGQQTSHWFELPGTAPEAVDLSRLAAEGLDVSTLRVQPCEDGGDVSIESIMPPGAAVASPAVDAAAV